MGQPRGRYVTVHRTILRFGEDEPIAEDSERHSAHRAAAWSRAPGRDASRSPRPRRRRPSRDRTQDERHDVQRHPIDPDDAEHHKQHRAENTVPSNSPRDLPAACPHFSQ
jgi:hypothetical protein